MSDLIERQAAIDAVEHITSSMSVCVNTDECHGMKRMQRQAVIELANLPSAQRKGKWIYPTDIKGYGRCPHCKALWEYSLISNLFFKFCPRCGNGENEFAEMKGEEDENNIFRSEDVERIFRDMTAEGSENG